MCSHNYIWTRFRFGHLCTSLRQGGLKGPTGWIWPAGRSLPTPVISHVSFFLCYFLRCTNLNLRLVGNVNFSYRRIDFPYSVYLISANSKGLHAWFILMLLTSMSMNPQGCKTLSLKKGKETGLRFLTNKSFVNPLYSAAVQSQRLWPI